MCYTIPALVEDVHKGVATISYFGERKEAFCEFTHLNELMKQFGITFNHVTLHRVTGTDYEMGASINLPDHPLFKGVTKVYLKEISDINLSGTAKST